MRKKVLKYICWTWSRKSFHSEDFSYEVMANDVIEYCDDNNLEKDHFLKDIRWVGKWQCFLQHYSELLPIYRS